MASAGIPVAAKTGTVSDSDGSTRDVWTAAYTPDLALTVWMGFDAPDGEHEMSSSEGGSGCPARLCAAFLNAVSDQLSGRDFAQPSSVRTVLVDTLALQAHDVRLAVNGQCPVYFFGRTGGMIPGVREVYDQLMSMKEGL